MHTAQAHHTATPVSCYLFVLYRSRNRLNHQIEKYPPQLTDSLHLFFTQFFSDKISLQSLRYQPSDITMIGILAAPDVPPQSIGSQQHKAAQGCTDWFASNDETAVIDATVANDVQPQVFDLPPHIAELTDSPQIMQPP
jgi:hypothetical protein